MSGGRSKAKGSAFERVVAAKLSLWITDGASKDVFYRNILSGGRFTVKDVGMPGDLMASDPRGFPLLSLLSVECKHHKDINFDHFMMAGAKSFLGRVYEKTRQQGEKDKLRPMLIAKGNRTGALVIVDKHTGAAFLDSIASRSFNYHLLHRNKYFVCMLDDLMEASDAASFMDILRNPSHA